MRETRRRARRFDVSGPPRSLGRGKVTELATEAKAGGDGQDLVGHQSARSMLRNFSQSDSVIAYVFIVPAVAWVLGIVVYPISYSIWLSVHGVLMVEPDPPFVGLDNFARILGSDAFWESLRLTMVWTGGSLLVIVPVGLLIAVLLNQAVRGTRLLRHWILLPWMFPIVVTILMWRWILDASFGVMNQMLLDVGIIDRRVSFLDASNAMSTLILVNAWRWIPFMAITLLAALQTVPKDLIEASGVDGASSRQRFRFIVFPHILPTLSVTTFMLSMWLFNMFPPIWLMTQGGPSGATTTLPVMIFVEGFQVFRQSVGAAMSVVLLLLLVGAAALYFRFSKQRLGQT